MAGEVIKLAAVKEPHFVYMALGAMMVGLADEWCNGCVVAFHCECQAVAEYNRGLSGNFLGLVACSLAVYKKDQWHTYCKVCFPTATYRVWYIGHVFGNETRCVGNVSPCTYL